jgi:hypothetical protein
MLQGYIDSLRSEIIGLFFTITVIVHFIKSQIEGLQRLRFYYNIYDFLPLIRAYNGEKDIRIQNIKLAVIKALEILLNSVDSNSKLTEILTNTRLVLMQEENR